MNNVDFTVLISTYWNDDEERLKKALSSIYNNTIKPKEIILIIDGDIKGESMKVVNEFKKRKDFISYKLTKNIGLAQALNFGLKKVTTEWVARADADDINLSYRFEKQINFLKENNKIDLFGSAIKEISDDGYFIRSTPLTENEIIKYAKKRNPFNHMTVMFRLNKILEVGGYPDLLKMQDYALWAKLISKKIRVKNMSEVLVHVSGGSNLIRRRGGLNYVMSEIKLQYYLYTNNIKKLHNALFDCFQRSIIFLLPFYFRKIIYEKFLR
jgi:glycosyltransferase involved in cell wall biosynthesis